MRFLGAKVVLTPAAGRGMGMVIKAIELARTHGWFLTRQFENEANPDMHSRTTAREIIEDFKGEKLDYWVTGYGTGGTLKGVSRVFAKEMPETKIVVCEPEDAQLLASGIEQARHPDGSPAAAHPAFKPHPMQGWTPDFIPKLTADVVQMKVIDRIIAIPGAEAIRCAGELASKEGMIPVDQEVIPPPAADYTPFATKLKDANPNWMWAWSPWFAQVRTYEALRRIGWQGRYLTWAHLNAEEELARIKDPDFYVIGTNAFFEDNLPIQAEIRAVAHRSNVKYPVTYLTEGFIVGLVLEAALKRTAWPPTPAKVTAAMGALKVDLKGLRGGPLEWTKDNHFRTRQYYRVWHWDAQKNAVVRVQDWQPIDVARQ